MRISRGRLNLRRRVTFALVAIVTLFISVQGVLAYLTLDEQEDDLVDFDRYYRGRLADSPGQERSDDHGLGLAIARQVADLNGWTLTATSEPGRGTCFTLALR